MSRLFGSLLLLASVQALAANSAAFVSQSVPTIMTPGQTYAVSVTMQNSGTTTWTAGSNYRLGTQNPQDNTVWTGLTRVALPNSVAPGQNVTFSFNVTAPATPGMYNFQWKMVQDLVEWFGAPSANVLVAVGDVNHAQFVAQSTPPSMATSQPYAVSVTMKNSGSRTWSPGTHYLRSQNPQDNSKWGLNRVELASAVAPGQNATFNFNISYPVTETVNFQWQMAEGTTSFGELTPNVAIGVTGGNNAEFVSQSVPTNMTPGQTYAVSVTMRNVGSSTWSSGHGFKLGTQNPQDNTLWTGLTRVALPHNVAPGQNVTFSFNVTAPSTVGLHNFQWRMLRESVEWFGLQSANLVVAVGSVSYAQFVSQTAPPSMATSQPYAVSVTVKNSGGTTWNPGTHYLRSQNPQDNSNWGLSRVELPSAVAPGQNVTLNFNISYPATDTVNFQWRMAEGTTNFGELTPNLAIGVTGANNAAFVSQNVPRHDDRGPELPGQRHHEEHGQLHLDRGPPLQARHRKPARQHHLDRLDARLPAAQRRPGPERDLQLQRHRALNSRHVQLPVAHAARADRVVRRAQHQRGRERASACAGREPAFHPRRSPQHAAARCQCTRADGVALGPAGAVRKQRPRRERIGARRLRSTATTTGTVRGQGNKPPLQLLS